MVGNGVAEVDDVPRNRLECLKLDREPAQAALDCVRAHTLPKTEIPPEMIARFAREMRENIANGNVPFRKASVIDQIEVGDHAAALSGIPAKDDSRYGFGAGAITVVLS